MKRKVIRTTFNLPEELIYQLKVRCIKEKISMTNSLTWYLDLLNSDSRTTREILGLPSIEKNQS